MHTTPPYEDAASLNSTRFMEGLLLRGDRPIVAQCAATHPLFGIFQADLLATTYVGYVAGIAISYFKALTVSWKRRKGKGATGLLMAYDVTSIHYYLTSSTKLSRPINAYS